MRILFLPMLMAASTLATAAAPPEPTQDLRLEGLEFVPLKAAANKRGDASAKPQAPVEFKPVEVALHFHIDADGRMQTRCSESHAPSEPTAEEAR